jgi:uncharacterized protein (TIGR02444 family)
VTKVSWADHFPPGASGALWRFAAAFYERPGVAPACLDLQDRFGRDVTLLLYVCWVGIDGRGRLSLADLVRAQAAVEPWRSAVVAPLRAVRRLVKESPDAADLYEAVKATELEAEHIALDRLEVLAPPRAGTAEPLAEALANLALYLGPGPVADAAIPLRLALAETVRRHD